MAAQTCQLAAATGIMLTGLRLCGRVINWAVLQELGFMRSKRKWVTLVNIASAPLGGIVGIIAGYYQAMTYLASLNGKGWAGDGMALPADMFMGGFLGMVGGGLFAFCFCCWHSGRR